MTSPPPGDPPALSQEAVGVLRRVDLTFRERAWPDEVYHHLVRGGMVADLEQAAGSPQETGDRDETVSMDVAVAAVAGVVAGMIRLERKDERRHQHRVAVVRRAPERRASLRRLSTRALLAGAVRRGAGRLRRRGPGVTQ